MPRVGTKTKTVGRIEDCRGVDALTSDRMKEMLGWSVVTDETADDASLPKPVLRDASGRNVRLLRNVRNRPFKERWCKTLMQDILNGHWRFNAETVIIGEHGNVLSGAHRLAAAVLAEEHRTGRNSPRWSTVWDGPITLECLVFHGLSESEDVTRTLDNTRPRSLTDVLFTDVTRFADQRDVKVREGLCRHLKVAVTLLWQRTGADDDRFHERRTHSETTDFLSRHPGLEDCVVTLHELLSTARSGETVRRRVPEGLSVGECAAMLYLMGSSATDGDEYRNADPRSESTVDWSRWERACKFWEEITANTAAVREVRHALNDVAIDPVTHEANSSKLDRLSVLAKGWLRYSIGLPLDRGTCLPEWVRPSADVGRQFLGAETCGGIDLGDPNRDDGDDDGQAVDDGPAFDAGGVDDGGDESDSRDDGDPSPDEIAELAAHERRRRQSGSTTRLVGGRTRLTISLDDVDLS